MTDLRIPFATLNDVRGLFGPQDRRLRKIREHLKVEVVVRGDEIQIHGSPGDVAIAGELIDELRTILHKQGEISDDEFQHVLRRCVATADVPHNGESPASVDVFHKAKRIVAKGPGQSEMIRAVKEHDLVLCTGPAGSGKTYLAVAMAVNALRQDLVRKIVLVRPAVEAGERLGFLPGDMFEKVNPYLRPLMDSLNDILDAETVMRYREKDVIEIAPLAYMRGRTLNDTFIILDEAQNATVTQMKMFLTRMGQRSKIVVTGDLTQVDLPEHVASGLQDAVKRLSGIPGIAVVRMAAADIVRHPLVRQIVAAYDGEKAASDGGEPGAHTANGTSH